MELISLLNAVRDLPVVDLGKFGVRNADLQRNLGHPNGEVGIAWQPIIRSRRIYAIKIPDMVPYLTFTSALSAPLVSDPST